MMEAHESDGGVDQNDEVAVFLKSYTPEGAVGFALHLRDGYKRENADLLAKVEQLEAERSELKTILTILQPWTSGVGWIQHEGHFFDMKERILNSLKTK